MTLTHKPFYFIRHGETDWNCRGIHMGSQDIPLNVLGIKQARSVALELKNIPIEYIATSPLIRARQTAQIIADSLDRPIIVIDDLKECCLGVREGLPVEDGTILKQWLEGTFYEGSEKVEDFTARVIRGFQQALELPCPVLIVAHGGVYRALQQSHQWPWANLSKCSPIYHHPL